jgi:hypothetical protein
LEIALSACTTQPELINVSELVDITRSTELTGTIDLVSNLKGDRVYLFSGTVDTVVKQGMRCLRPSDMGAQLSAGVMEKLSTYYKSFGCVETRNFSTPCEHAMISNSFGNACNYLGSPYINNCNYDLAFELLSTLLGPLNTPVQPISANVRSEMSDDGRYSCDDCAAP